MKNFIWIISIVVIFFVLSLLYNNCSDKKDTSSGNILKSDTFVKHDTITYHDTVSKPKPVFRDTGSTKYIPAVIDSAHIFEAYVKLHHLFYTRNIYKDTLKNDSIALIAVLDTVYMNELQRRELIYQNRTPQYIITNTVMTPSTGRLLLGAEYAFKSSEYRIGVHYMTKGYMEYIYVYNPQRGEHSVGFYMTIFPRNRSPSK